MSSSTKTNKTNIKYPVVKDQNEMNDELTFTLHNTNVSVANALRRTMLSDIETVVCNPYEKNSIVIFTNTTKLNNEIIKQRIGCIPVHIVDLTINVEDLLCEINKTNDTDALDYITTKDIKIKLKSTGKYISEKEVNKIFPANKLTGDYILINRLKPKISKDLPGESLHMEFKLSKGKSSMNGMFNVVSTCGYGNTGDKVRQQEEWDKVEQQIKNKYKTLDDETAISNKDIKAEIAYEKENWFNHHAKRIYLKDSFDFKLESVGVFTNTNIVMKACDAVMLRLDLLIKNINNSNIFKLEYNATTIPNSVDILLFGEDYTASKLIEYVMYEEYFKKKMLKYVGCYKKHPHDNNMVLRLGFPRPDDNNEENIKNIFKTSCTVGHQLFKKIKSYFD